MSFNQISIYHMLNLLSKILNIAKEQQILVKNFSFPQDTILERIYLILNSLLYTLVSPLISKIALPSEKYLIE